MTSAKQRGRQMERRIVALLSETPMTISDMAARFQMTISNISFYIKRMRNSSPKLVYVSSFKENTGRYAGRPAPIYSAGSKPDLEFVPLRRPVPKISAQQRRERVLELLAEKPSSSIELGKKMFVVRDTALRYLTQLHNERQIYIARWVHPNKSQPGRGGSYTPIYAIGSKDDAPRPQKETSQARHARRRQNKAYVEAERQRAAKRRERSKNKVKPQGIFAPLGI